MSKEENKDESKDSSRSTAINKAIDDVDKESSKDKKDDKKDDKEITDKKDDENEEQDDSEENDENDENEDGATEESEAAIRLYRALNDKEMGPALVKMLAEKQGFEVKGASEKEQKNISKTIEDLVKEELGDDFSIFAGKLSSILRKIVPAIAEDRVRSLREEVYNDRQAKTRETVSSAMDATFAKYEVVPDKVQKAMSRLMDEMPPSKNTTPARYFDRILKLAASETKIDLKLKDGSDDSENTESNKIKTDRNQRDASSRLASKRDAEVKDGKGAPKQFKDRRSAIEQAMKDVEAQMK